MCHRWLRGSPVFLKYETRRATFARPPQIWISGKPLPWCVCSGETVVLGGLIQDHRSDTQRSVPGLADAPILGNFFKGTYQIDGKRELAIFMTARLVPSGGLNIAAR